MNSFQDRKVDVIIHLKEGAGSLFSFRPQYTKRTGGFNGQLSILLLITVLCAYHMNGVQAIVGGGKRGRR